MSRAIEHGKTIVLEMIEGMQSDLDEADLVYAFKDYLVDQQYVSEEECASLPNSAKQICDALASRFGWSIACTADTLFDFGVQVGIDWVDGETRRGESKDRTNWRHEGF
ncbi:MAG: hypothetical protein ACYC0X_12335 [Pirellulaceae bacterium]